MERFGEIEIPLVILLIVVFVVVGIVLSSIAAGKRQEAFKKLASSLGMIFYPGKDYSYDERYSFINKLCRGKNRYAFNIVRGEYRGYAIQLFDYHYETHSTDSKGKRKKHHHYFSFFILQFGRNFPELVIAREGWFSKIAQWFGYADIDFESAEFSRKFIVRSPDKKFAYDICHAQMIEYMLQNSDLSIEIERDCLTLFFPSRLTLEQMVPNLDRLIEIREMFPRYLMES